MLEPETRTRLQAFILRTKGNALPVRARGDKPPVAPEESEKLAPGWLPVEVSPEEERRHRLPAGEVVETESGVHYSIRVPVTRIWSGAASCLAGGEESARLLLQGEDEVHADLTTLAAAFPAGTLFLDLETCGFAGAMVFLIGLIRVDNGEVVLHQLLARNYAEERPILETLWQLAAANRVLVTFNGKSFDWPQIRDRSMYHRRRKIPQPHHVDLLHHSRRRWKHALPNCRLQTLERYLCGRFRRGDIPGSEIPAAYHRWVRTEDAIELRSILHHNALDLVTLLQLTVRMLAPSSPQEAEASENERRSA